MVRSGDQPGPAGSEMALRGFGQFLLAGLDGRERLLDGVRGLPLGLAAAAGGKSPARRGLFEPE